MKVAEIIKELKESSGKVLPEPAKDKAEPAKSGKHKTKEEIEAYRQKKMAEEEARYLGKQPKKREKAEKAEKVGKTRTEGPKPRKESEAKTGEKVQKVKRAQKVEKVRKVPSKMLEMPKMLKPLVPLYLLHIPGLPKGDGIVICYAEGVGE